VTLEEVDAVVGDAVCIIVHYGAKGLTDNAVESVIAGDRRPGRIIVVDHGPRYDRVSDPRDPQVTVIRPKRNLGFGGGVNAAVEILSPRERLLWLLNNDAVAEPGALSALLASNDRLREHALISSTVIDVQTGALWYRRATFLPWRLEGRHEPGPAPVGTVVFRGRPSVLGVIYMPGCSILVPRRLFEDLGGFDSSYFLYGEDVDFSLRAVRSGWSLALDGASLIRHHASSGTTEPVRERMKARTSLLLTIQFYPWIVPIALPMAVITGLKRAIVRRRLMWLSARMIGYVDALRSLGKSERT
jgi:hypothetical protein